VGLEREPQKSQRPIESHGPSVGWRRPPLTPGGSEPLSSRRSQLSLVVVVDRALRFAFAVAEPEALVERAGGDVVLARVDGFTRKTFTAMIEGTSESAIAAGLIGPETFDAGVRDPTERPRRTVCSATRSSRAWERRGDRWIEA
jgi:hypothetical protein